LGKISNNLNSHKQKKETPRGISFLLYPKIELDFVQFRLQMIDDFDVVNICFAIYSEVV
jgi:hypothetical protein